MTPQVKSVALNAMFLAPGDSGGPETYLRELVHALAGEYPDLRMTLLTTRSGKRALTEIVGNSTCGSGETGSRG